MKTPLYFIKMKSEKFEIMDSDGLYIAETPIKRMAEEIIVRIDEYEKLKNSNEVLLLLINSYKNKIKSLEEENDTLADTVNMLSPLMMKCHNQKKLLEEVLSYGEEGLCIDGNFADRIARVIEE